MKQILLTTVFSLILFFLLNNYFNTQHSTLLSIIFFLVVLWSNEALPLGVVSLLPIILFPSFDILSTNATASNYSNSIIFLFLGGFMIAIATQKIELHKYISNKLLTFFPNTVRGIVFSLAITSAFLSSLISNTTTALLLIPIAIYLSDEINIKFRFVLAIAYGASIGGIITPIGTPPNLILLGFMEQHNLEAIPFLKWIVLTLPLAIVMLIVIPYVLSIGVKKLENGLMSSYLNSSIKVGDSIKVSEPRGRFTIQGNLNCIIAIAAGSGITPIMSMLKQILFNTDKNFYLVYSNKSEKTTMFLSAYGQPLKMA